MIVKIYTDRMAEIIVEAEEVPDAMDLVRLLLARGITVAEIIRTTQTAKESPLPTVCDPTGGGQSS
jgi:2-keto-3-deoxy-6-phosphogluconate aldolase